MKKILVIMLTFVLVLGFSGAALAAATNPFVDVPAKHWSYDAVSKLASAGIIDGYGDGTFRGDRTMTRYEMAQVVAKAMARSDKANAELKALIDKLAVEFAAELNNLGVRVAKLEDKTKISWTFESRIRYGNDDNKKNLGTNQFDWRQRIMLNGNVNDNVSYFARLETNKTDGTSGNVPAGETGNKNIGFNRAGFNVKDFLGINNTTIGRFGTMGWTPGLLMSRTSNNDGLAISHKFGNVDFRAATMDVDVQSQINFFSLGFKPADNFKLGVAYQTENINGSTTGTFKWPVANITSPLVTKSIDVNAVVKLGDFNLTGEYVNTKDRQSTGSDLTRKAYAFQITNGITDAFYPVYNLVNPTKPHTDAFAISYRRIEPNATPITSGFNSSSIALTSASGTMNYDNDVKGYYLTYQNVVSKGVIWSIEYQDVKSIVNDSTGAPYKDKLWNTSFQFFF